MKDKHVTWGCYVIYNTCLYKDALSWSDVLISVFSGAIHGVSCRKNSLRPSDPSKPGSLGGVRAFATAQGISPIEAQRQLEQTLSYTLHKPRRPRFPTLPTMVYGINEQFVMDLVDRPKLAKWNKGYKYLLTVIDVLSKYAWVEPLKRKSATELDAAWERLWKRLGTRHPEKVQTDSGGEFYNSKAQAFFKKQGVHHFSTHGDPHGSVVERWNHSKQKCFVILRLKTCSSILMCYRL